MKQPAYRTIYNTLIQEIRDGKYKTGQLLPTENMIKKRFGFSRTTVRRALELLSRDGYVEAQQGRGTVVLDFTTVQRLNELTSISETLKSRGFTVYTKSMHIDSVKAIPKVADALMVKEGETVVRIQRVQCAQDQPIAIMTNYLIEELVPGIERHNGKFTSLYAFLESEYGIVLSSAVEHLSAGIADFSEAQILGVPIGSPLLISKRITYNCSKPVEYAHMKILGDKYEYAVYMEGRPRL
jgi:GntR family transcriptional regulator